MAEQDRYSMKKPLSASARSIEPDLVMVLFRHPILFYVESLVFYLFCAFKNREFDINVSCLATIVDMIHWKRCQKLNKRKRNIDLRHFNPVKILKYNLLIYHVMQTISVYISRGQWFWWTGFVTSFHCRSRSNCVNRAVLYCIKTVP